MATYYLESIKDDSENEFVFKLKGINYVDGLPSALSSKAEETSVVHINGNETIAGTKTFSNGATVEGTLAVSYIDGTGVIETDGIIRSTGSTIYSQRTSWPLVGARKIDSNGDLLGYAKLEVDNNDKLRLISADADNVDTSIIKYEDGDFKYIGSAKLSTLNVTGNATVTGNITAGGTISSTGGRFYATKSGTSNCGYEFGNGARYFKFIMNGSQMILQDVGGSGTASPTSNKNVIYSSGSGDSTAYYFNGNASTATTATKVNNVIMNGSDSTATYNLLVF